LVTEWSHKIDLSDQLRLNENVVRLKERSPEKAGVGGSTPSLATTSKPFANLILLAVIGSFIA
jgi:hypothetical protein